MVTRCCRTTRAKRFSEMAASVLVITKSERTLRGMATLQANSSKGHHHSSLATNVNCWKMMLTISATAKWGTRWYEKGIRPGSSRVAFNTIAFPTRVATLASDQITMRRTLTASGSSTVPPSLGEAVVDRLPSAVEFVVDVPAIRTAVALSVVVSAARGSSTWQNPDSWANDRRLDNLKGWNNMALFDWCWSVTECDIGFQLTVCKRLKKKTWTGPLDYWTLRLSFGPFFGLFFRLFLRGRGGWYNCLCLDHSLTIFLPFHSQVQKVHSPNLPKEKCMGEVVRIGSVIIFHPSNLWKAKFFILCDVIFLVRLQGKFDFDHSWEWKG